MKSAELREKYLSFFEAKGCKRMPSSSLIPDDPSMLLTSAGMVQFKPYFLQQKQLEAPYVGTATVQKCVRTTDIDIIGTTGRHLSFFEMLGNFSFGEYFKEEMCAWAYEFSTEVLGFDPERLYFTVYLDDDETIDIWKSIGVPESRIKRLGEADNFWTAGPTGPCGPCSELYYDQGVEFGCGAEDCGPGCDCDRFLEYWNCVFTQFDRQENGDLVPLPKRNIDTGMGLERTAAILQGVQSNYETDILRGLIAVGERLSNKTYSGKIIEVGANASTQDQEARDDLALRICADHSRAVAFMIADGVLPSNEGRGYVLRRLLRRAVRYGRLLGIDGVFLNSYIEAVIAEMGAPYPELLEHRVLIERIVNAEEERFGQTIRNGQIYLDAHIEELKAQGGELILSGANAFELHDRYGFPIDLTVEISAENGVIVDRVGFEVQMREQRQRARAAAKDDAWGSIGSVFTDVLNSCGATQFVGYSTHQCKAVVKAIIVEQTQDGVAGFVETDSIGNGQRAQVVLDSTPFYGEMGGQVGDTGTLTVHSATSFNASASTFKVEDTQVHDKAIYVHVGTIDGSLSVGDEVVASVDSLRRERIERNHTATHLLHHALYTILGEHIKQAGSLVTPERLRFDFTHFEALSAEQLEQVESLVNELVMADGIVSSYETSLDDARAAGVTALFGEKYGDRVRVLEAGANSRELCGGTHVQHTAQIGFIKITSESSVGANLRRIEAITSFDALEYVNRNEAVLREAARALKVQPQVLPERIEALQVRVRELEAQLKDAHRNAATASGDELEPATAAAGYALIVARLDGRVVDDLRDIWDTLKQRANADGLAVVLGSITPSGAPLLLASGDERALAKGFDAGALIKDIAKEIQGGGGGKPSMAQAGGKNASGMDAALDKARAALLG